MEGSSKQQQPHPHHNHITTSHLHPPSPVDEEYPPTPSPRTNVPPSSPWVRKPHDHPERQASPEDRLHVPADPDLEPGTADEQKTGKRRVVCGRCSKSTFIIVIFFLIVIVAAAIGGGVGGTMFADRRFVRSTFPFLTLSLQSGSCRREQQQQSWKSSC